MRCLSKNSLSKITCLLTLAASSALSQTAEPKIRTATFYTIKPDHRAEFLSTMKEVTAALKKGGSERHFSLWSSQSGPGEFVDELAGALHFERPQSRAFGVGDIERSAVR